MHEVLVNRLGGLSLPRKSVVRLTDRPDMTLDVYRGRKTTMQQQCNNTINVFIKCNEKNINVFTSPKQVRVMIFNDSDILRVHHTHKWVGYIEKCRL